MPDLPVRIALIGAGATAILDLWSLAQKRLMKTPAPDYGLVGRWVGHMARRRFAHPGIAASVPIRGERALGWLVHYATGGAFAALLATVAGPGWLDRPTLLPAVVFGLATVAFPWLVMQPAFGLGVAASRSPNPAAARRRSLTAHLVFGVGLYLAATLVSP